VVPFGLPAEVLDTLSLYATSSGAVTLLATSGDAHGHYIIQGGSLWVQGDLELGMVGVGTFSHNNGSVTVDGALSIANGESLLGTSRYDMDGGTLSAGWLIVGDLKVSGVMNYGIFDHDDGTVTVANDLIVGHEWDDMPATGWGDGTYNLTGASAQLDVIGSTFVGNQGEGTFSHSQGTHTTEQLILGADATGSGSYTLSGAGGAFIGGSGDRFFIRGDFLSQSDAATAWNTDRADLIFRQGSTGRHTMNVTSEDRGAVGAAWTDNFAWGRVSIEAGETVILADAGAPGGALYTQNLALETGATLDAADLNLRLKAAPVNQGTVDMATGNLVVEYDGASPFEAIAEQLRCGLSDGPTGYWDGPGIHSGDAAADAQRITALGVIDNSDSEFGIGGLAEFAGEPVSLQSVLVAYCWYGDANLDGVVDTNDYDKINTAWLLWTAEGIVPDGGFRWAVGDFNYDGTIDSNDYDRINNAWLLSEGGLLSGAAPAPTPEPATLALLAAASIVLLAPRRKRGDA